MRSRSFVPFVCCLLPFTSSLTALAQPPSTVPVRGLSPAAEPVPPRQPLQPGVNFPSQPKQRADLLSPDATRGAQPLNKDQGENLIRFDPLALEVRSENRRLKLYAGKIMLKDFGMKNQDAGMARRLLLDLRLNEYGAIGTPEPVMEYWLRDGQAPPVTGLSRTGVSFDPTKLSVEKDDGSYCVRDRGRVLFSFGPFAEDAERALAVIRKYEFNEVAYIGLPNPTMIYMLKNTVPNHHQGGHDPFRPEYLPQHATRYPLDIPGLGIVGERRPIDAMRLETVRVGDNWHLMSGATDLGSVGSSEYQARNMMQIAQRYPFTEYVRVGASDFTFFLCRNQAPRETPLGIHCDSFQPKLLNAKQTADNWIITDGQHSIATFRTGAEAQTAIKVIQYYKFDCNCCVSNAMHYLAREH